MPELYDANEENEETTGANTVPLAKLRGGRGRKANTARAPLIVIADRGTLKAYKVRQTNHGLSPRLMTEKNLKSGHERFRDKVTDYAGAFPSLGSGGRANAIAERTSFELEEDARIFKEIAQQIKELIRQNEPLGWLFAAAAEINPAILDHLPADLRGKLVENVKHDLTKTPADTLTGHFKKLGRFRFSRAHKADAVDVEPGATFVPVQELPESALQFLLPSRYCQSDLLNELASSIVGRAPAGFPKNLKSLSAYIPSSFPLDRHESLKHALRIGYDEISSRR